MHKKKNPHWRRCAITLFHTVLGSAGKDREAVDSPINWITMCFSQRAEREPVSSAAMMSQCLITTQPEDLGFFQLSNDIIGNWFRRLLQAVFYETWNCWTKQKTSWTGAQKALAGHEGTLLMAYQYPLAWKPINHPSFNWPGGKKKTYGMQTLIDMFNTDASSAKTQNHITAP